MVADAETATEVLHAKLKVRKSPVRFRGSARVHNSVLEKIGSTKKDQVAIISDKKTILRTFFADDLIEEDIIVLRPIAMKQLGVKEGEEVVVGSRDVVKDIVALLKEQSEKREKEE